LGARFALQQSADAVYRLEDEDDEVRVPLEELVRKPELELVRNPEEEVLLELPPPEIFSSCSGVSSFFLSLMVF
jgi:hypothetical protein